MKLSSIESYFSKRDRRRGSWKVAAIALALACSMTNSEGGVQSGSKNAAIGQQPSQNWYAENEWNVNLFGAYAFTANANDRYLDVDHGFGGGIDAKYFFARYFGLGVEGYALSADRLQMDRKGSYFLSLPPFFHGVKSRTKPERAVGAVLGTFTLRYPIPRSRLAPYAYLGCGGIFGGGEKDTIVFSPGLNEILVHTQHTGEADRFVGQFGAGLELRLTPHIGIINDFSWNVISGAHNNFGMVRSGINFAF